MQCKLKPNYLVESRPPPLPTDATQQLQLFFRNLPPLSTFVSLKDAGFRTIDEDGDGVITSGELMMGLKMPAVRANKYMVAFDMNRDGGLQLSGKTETKIHTC